MYSVDLFLDINIRRKISRSAATSILELLTGADCSIRALAGAVSSASEAGFIFNAFNRARTVSSVHGCPCGVGNLALLR